MVTFGGPLNKTHLHKLADLPTVPVAHLYKHMINNNRPMFLFDLADESVDDPAPILTTFSHTRIYITAIWLLIPTGLGIFCCYFFWCWPAILVHWNFQSGSLQHTIVDDDVEASPIYRSDSMAGQPVIKDLVRIKTCVWNGNLHRRRWSNKYHQKQFLNSDHWIQNPKSREYNEHTWFVVRLRIGPVTASLKKLRDN